MKKTLPILILGASILGGTGAYLVHRHNPAPIAIMTLNPAQFTGSAQLAYEAAQKHPELLMQLECYCGCKKYEGHNNLLDCFRTDHGSHCTTCTGEAIDAVKLADQGMPVEQIRAALHARYVHN